MRVDWGEQPAAPSTTGKSVFEGDVCLASVGWTSMCRPVGLEAGDLLVSHPEGVTGRVSMRGAGRALWGCTESS